ncbi:MAG: hypothetical protein ABW221_14450 [Vicinamibacteria bacterium]
MSSRTPLGPPAPPPGERHLRFRLMLMALSICLWGVVITLRLVQLQVVERASYTSQAARQGRRTVDPDSRRAAVAHRSGHAPARSLGPASRARKQLRGQLRQSRAFVWVKRNLQPRYARAMRHLRHSAAVAW